jgi:hypothetical protein
MVKAGDYEELCLPTASTLGLFFDDENGDAVFSQNVC